MTDTVFNPRPDDEGRLMQGHGFDGSPMPFVPTPETIECAGGLYTTPNDMLKWMRWHLDRFAPRTPRCARSTTPPGSTATGSTVVSASTTAAATMDAMGLGWVVMMPEGDRPLILHKSRRAAGHVRLRRDRPRPAASGSSPR